VEALACRLSGDAERDRDLVPGPAVCPSDLDRLTQPGLVGTYSLGNGGDLTQIVGVIDLRGCGIQIVGELPARSASSARRP
jgi:hypothetical protein